MVDGLTQQQIAKQLGLAQSTISLLYRQALELVPWKTVDQRRELALLQLDEATEKVIDVLRADHPYVSEGRVVYQQRWDEALAKWVTDPDLPPLQDAKPVLQAATTLATLLKRVADTIGSDAPKRLETANVHVKAEDLRVANLLPELKALSASRAAEIRSRAENRRELPPGVPRPSQPAATGIPVGAVRMRMLGVRDWAARPATVARWDPEHLFE